MEEHLDTFKMETNFEGLIQLLARNLYSDPDVFLRELIQNAHDSIVLRCQEQPEVAGRIDIESDPSAGTLVFRDNGMGMDEADIRQFLSVIGSTGTGTRRQQLQEEGREGAYKLIGQFGIGMLSAFVVARKVLVRTRKLGGDQAFSWVNSGSTDCVLYSADRPTVGTDVVLTVDPLYAYLLDEKRLHDAVIKYCDFIPFPIYVNGKGPENAVMPPWHREHWSSESEKESAYRQYLDRRYPMDTPLAIIPVEIDGVCQARGALYISDRHVPDVNTTGVVDLFVRRMFVRADDNETLPEWAKFVRGLIDSPDLQPTAARDNVQRTDDAFVYVKQRLGELILSHLSKLARTDKNKFLQINLWHHYHLKGMALYYDDFFKEIAGLLLVETNRGLMSLDDYLMKNAPRAATGNKAPIYYFAFRGAAAQFYRLAEATGWVVINAGAEFEEELLTKYAQYNSGKVFLQRLDATDDPAIFERLDPDDEERFRQFEDDMEANLRRFGIINVAVRMRRYAPAELPAVIILTPESEAELKLRDIVSQPWFREELEDVAREALASTRRRPIYLQLNATNTIVQQLSQMNRREPAVRELMHAMYIAAVLYSHNLLTQENAEGIHRQFLQMCTRIITQHQEIQAVENERRQMMDLRERHATLTPKRPRHVVLFMITPFTPEYDILEQAVREIFERPPYFFEVLLARNYTFKSGLLDNVRQHMAQAHGFIAEISDLNPNVMLELGAAMFASDDRPIFSLRHQQAKSEVPADLKEKLYIPYGSLSDTPDTLVKAVRNAVERDGRPNHDGVVQLLSQRQTRHLSRTLLRSLSTKPTEAEMKSLLGACHTVEALTEADPAGLPDLAQRLGIRPFILAAIDAELRTLPGA